MINLSQLTNSYRKKNKVQRVGRGPGSKRGKTSTRGHKGDKSRSGYKRREGKEGGQVPLFKKLPTRGFSNARFKKDVFALTLTKINSLYSDGEVVNIQSLITKGYSLKNFKGTLKVIGDAEVEKKVTIEADKFSKGALKKLDKNSIEYKILTK